VDSFVFLFHASGFRWLALSHDWKLKLIYDRQSVGLCLGVRRPSGTCDQFFFLLKISFRQLRVYFVGPSLTRGRICNLLVQLLLGLARAVTLGSKSRRTHEHILLSHLRLPQPGGPGSCIYIPQEQGGPVIPNSPCCVFSGRTQQKTLLPLNLVLYDVSTAAERCLLRHRLATGDVLGVAALTVQILCLREATVTCLHCVGD
jgi:hypothetical protein